MVTCGEFKAVPQLKPYVDLHNIYALYPVVLYAVAHFCGLFSGTPIFPFRNKARCQSLAKCCAQFSHSSRYIPGCWLQLLNPWSVVKYPPLFSISKYWKKKKKKKKIKKTSLRTLTSQPLPRIFRGGIILHQLFLTCDLFDGTQDLNASRANNSPKKDLRFFVPQTEPVKMATCGTHLKSHETQVETVYKIRSCDFAYHMIVHDACLFKSQ